MTGHIIAMAVHDTNDNQRTEYTEQVLECLKNTVDRDRHRIVIIDNNSCEQTKLLLSEATKKIDAIIVTLSENVGTARAINYAIGMREPWQHVCKLDNDCVIQQSGWLDELVEAADRDSNIGIAGLKRVDLEEYPDHPLDHYKSMVYMLPHERGQRWIIGESVKHIMGTCTLLTSRWLEKCGYMFQVNKYGLDDYNASARCVILGMKNVFLPHIPIVHLDRGGTEYCDWKQREAGEAWDKSREIVQQYINGTRPLYEEI